ncbi:metal ABC transporter ATP-binding protein [Actinomyces faecalis]|uniref:metal ABC transporter ATP-binding protein n=1 Tax=Actinomyces faecalis TaxID=2722820 RepID=UPI001551AB8E|nr:metal ABC transporter ATP-binding protein [Actinomyces faecalis]
MSAAGHDQHPIVVEDASVVLGHALVLAGIDLTVTAGQCVALLGANGSGKSTLVKTIMGLHPLRSGSVRLFGHDVDHRSSVPWRRVGYVPQRVAASSGVPATALEVVRSGLLDPRRPFADRGRRARDRALAALDAVGLADRAGDHVQVFSGGQCQRVLIARALVRDPDLLILDEPLAGIDRASRQSLADTLTTLRGQGLTLLTVLHEMGELAAILDRAVVLSEGRVVCDGPAAALTPARHDHGEHDVIGHDYLDDCEHEHPHGDAVPTRHHTPDLTGLLGPRSQAGAQ